jgi:hypothetical protein
VGRVAEFALSQVRDLQRVAGAPMPRPAQCQIVTRIASHGVAAQVGVAKKDLLSAIDGQPAAGIEPRLYEQPVETRAYSFYSRARHERIELVATGIELGIELERTTPAIRAGFDGRSNDPVAQETLWANRDYAVLQDITEKVLGVRGKRETPALLFHGVALYEAGQKRSGIDEVHEYLLKYSKNWTMNFGGIARYYAGLFAQVEGRTEHAQKLFEEAWVYNRSDRMADLLEKATGRRPEKPASRWLQRRFPVEYEYASFDVPEPQRVSLLRALSGMSNDELLCVCLLVSYRSNGPYYDLLQRWQNYLSFMGEFFAGMHVLTLRTERYPDREHHYEMESRVRALGKPFHLLHEDNEAVVMAMAPDRSPSVFLLDRTGTVVYDGDLDSVDTWDALASVSA